MNVNRKIEVRDQDPVVRLRDFLSAWWRETGLDAMLAPVEQPDGSNVIARVIESPAALEAVNPFAPVMLVNAAAAVGKFSRDHPGGHLAALLRPCELRALVELHKRRHGQAASEDVLTVGVDCLATLPPDEFTARAKLEGIGALSREALEYAAVGDCSPRKPRAACRVCEWPAPRGADIVVGVIGVAPAEYLLVVARDERTDERLRLAGVTDGEATEYEVVRREVAVGAIARKRAKARAEVVKSDSQRFSDVGSLLSWIAGCSLCGECLDACPLYDGELSGLSGVGVTRHGGRPLLAELIDVGRWLASCSGCGMCEEACTCGVPITMLVASLTQRIRDELHYTPGDPASRLPWALG